MRKIPASILLLTASGLVLSVWLVVEGLTVRFTGHYFTAGGLWQTAAEALHFSPADLVWPMVTLGLTWIGGLAAVWSRSSWGYPSVVALAVLSILFLGWGTILAAAALISVWFPASRSFLQEKVDEQG